MRPSLASDNANVASIAPIAMSQQATRPTPPPYAAPCTRATVGFAHVVAACGQHIGERLRRRQRFCARVCTPPSSSSSCKSAPAQKLGAVAGQDDHAHRRRRRRASPRCAIVNSAINDLVERVVQRPARSSVTMPMRIAHRHVDARSSNFALAALAFFAGIALDSYAVAGRGWPGSRSYGAWRQRGKLRRCGRATRRCSDTRRSKSTPISSGQNSCSRTATGRRSSGGRRRRNARPWPGAHPARPTHPRSACGTPPSHPGSGSFMPARA